MTVDHPPAPGARSAADALEQLLRHEAWAAIRMRDSATVTLVGGTRGEVESLVDVPLETGAPEGGRRFDRLLAVPFRQVGERGFAAHDDGAPLTVVRLDSETEAPLADMLAALPDDPVEFEDRGAFETSDDEYAAVVDRIIRDEIGRGEGANLVVGRHYRARLRDWGPRKALTVFRRLLEKERGAYWTYVFFTGERYLVGASPERHVSVHGGDVRMNPISGTFRLPREDAVPTCPTTASATSVTAAGAGAADGTKRRLLEFLADEKEIYELFMVVDEELKMMCDICNEGGQVLGPFLKPMTHLIHTEYLLAGRTSRDVREVLRDTMYAATVTGSPVENACRLIERYETTGRGYYGAALALLGRDRDGEPTADSPIVIRTADISLDGALRVTAGATLVRDSDPAYEVAETHAKAGGILSAFGLVPAAPASAAGVEALTADEDVTIALASRNQRLSRFWLTDQGGATPVPELKGRSAVILDGEDDFVNMLRHVLAVLGMTSRVLRYDEVGPDDLAVDDLVIVGPGPGDPRNTDHPKIAAFAGAVDTLLDTGRPFLAVCLGHQVLCSRLGLDLDYKDIVFQGTQSGVVLGAATGRPAHEENVGFYNTFVARQPASGLPAGVRVDADPQTGDVHQVAGPHYRGVQFHAESILTERGYELLRDLIVDLLR